MSTSNVPPESASLRATCTPTSITAGSLNYTLTIRLPDADGAIAIDVGSVAVFVSENGAQQAQADYPAFSKFTLNPGKSVTLHLTSPLGAVSGAGDTWACGLSGVNVSE